MSLVNDLNTINTIKQTIKSAIETKGQNVTNFASYPASIENIVSGGNGVKQYDSLENMYADISNAHTDDLAVVYASTQAPITATTEFQVATFPQTVVLDEALSDYVEVGFQALDESVMFDCWGNLDSDYFRMDCYTDDGDIRIQYESQDGITYNRTRFMKNDEDISGNEVDFGLVIKFGSRWGDFEWNSAIGKFIISGLTVFDGVFKYNGSNFNMLSDTGLTANIENVWSGKFYGTNRIQNGTLSQTTNLNLQQLKDRVSIYSNLSSLRLYPTVTNISNLFFGLSNLTIVPNMDTSNVIDMSYMFEECNNLMTVPNFDTSNVTSMSSMFEYCQNLNTIPNFDTSNVTDMVAMFDSCYNLNIIPNLDTSNVVSMYGMFQYDYNLATVPNFDTSNVTSMVYMFYSCHNLTNVPNFDTSNVTSMVYMFDDCSNLTSVPNFNTSKVTNMGNMLGSCSNLKNVPNFDTSNVVSMYYMFAFCNNLVNAPTLNTSKVTDMCCMFRNCLNLITVSEFNTNNVTSMSEMFSYCSNLSANSYANIANSLPLAANLSNYYLLNIGLNIENFTLEQKKILGNKGYIEAIPYIINTSNVSTYWNIYYV